MILKTRAAQGLLMALGLPHALRFPRRSRRDFAGSWRETAKNWWIRKHFSCITWHTQCLAAWPNRRIIAKISREDIQPACPSKYHPHMPGFIVLLDRPIWNDASVCFSPHGCWRPNFQFHLLMDLYLYLRGQTPRTPLWWLDLMIVPVLAEAQVCWLYLITIFWGPFSGSHHMAHNLWIYPFYPVFPHHQGM